MPNPVTVILKDEDGVDHAYTATNGVRLNKQGGGTQDFYLTEGTALLTDTTSVDVRDKANAQIDAANVANLSAGNIKKNVSILGVTGSYEGITPSGKKLITDENETDVTAYATAQVDTANVANLLAGNIKNGVTILGVTGNYSGGGTDTRYYDLLGKNIVSVTSADMTEIGVDTYGNYLRPYMFAGCSALSSLVIPVSGNGVTIPTHCFAECYNLAISDSLFPETISEISDHAFTHSGITQLTIPEGCGFSGDEVFRECYELTSVSFEDLGNDDILFDGVAKYMCQYCNRLTSFTMSESVTPMYADDISYDAAFGLCSELQTVVLQCSPAKNGNPVSMLGTFMYCTNLSSVTLLNLDSVPTVNDMSFYGVPNGCDLYVPSSMVSALQAETRFNTIFNIQAY